MITNSIRPIKKKNITEIVFQQLLNQIVSGYWAPGDKLPSENELCKMLNVSRISIRAALNRLNGLGMIETRQGEGSFIKLASADIILNPLLPKVLLEPMNMLHIMEYRKIIESGTVALVVDIIQPQDIIRLETIIDEMEKNKQNIELFELNDFNGHRVSLNNYKGKTVILNFWTIDCEPCKEEIPLLNKLSKWEDSLNFKLITVSVDQKQRLENFMANYKELFVLMDPESEVVTRKYGTEKFPETWIINSEGYVVCRFDGPRNWLDSVFLSYIGNLSKSKNYW